LVSADTEDVAGTGAAGVATGDSSLAAGSTSLPSFSATCFFNLSASNLARSLSSASVTGLPRSRPILGDPLSAGEPTRGEPIEEAGETPRRGRCRAGVTLRIRDELERDVRRGAAVPGMW
jgi:hypothetical protein